jgi:hypothetical protein
LADRHFADKVFDRLEHGPVIWSTVGWPKSIFRRVDQMSFGQLFFEEKTRHSEKILGEKPFWIKKD